MYKQIARASTLLALVSAAALAQQPDTRPTLAVLPFVNSAIGASNAELAPLSKGIADLLITEMAQNTGIRVVERENLEKMLQEQNLARDGRVDEATAARVGKLLGAKQQGHHGAHAQVGGHRDRRDRVDAQRPREDRVVP
jgi:curli biogenesis system outer membrane secretion channel CsgG